MPRGYLWLLLHDVVAGGLRGLATDLLEPGQKIEVLPRCAVLEEDLGVMIVAYQSVGLHKRPEATKLADRDHGALESTEVVETADEGGDQLLATQAIRILLESPGSPELRYHEEDAVDVLQRSLPSGT